VQHTKPRKYTKWPQTILCYHKMFQMAIINTSIIHSKAYQNEPKLWYFVWKYTIWQPWSTFTLF
jgi:hypothetical protein